MKVKLRDLKVGDVFSFIGNTYKDYHFKVLEILPEGIRDETVRVPYKGKKVSIFDLDLGYISKTQYYYPAYEYVNKIIAKRHHLPEWL